MADKTKISSKLNKIDKQAGKIVSIIGPVIDLEFAPGNLPEIYNAVEVKTANGTRIVLEVQQHLGDNVVRAVSLGSTDGLKRNIPAINTGAPISVPVGIETLGRIFNVTGDPIDNKGPVKAKKSYPIHRPAPALTEQ